MFHQSSCSYSLFAAGSCNQLFLNRSIAALETVISDSELSWREIQKILDLPNVRDNVEVFWKPSEG